MISIEALSALPLAACYAETHFRFFKMWPSLLAKDEPEVIFDAPARLAPGRDLPVLLLLNDVDRYPVEVLALTLTVSQDGKTRKILEINDIATAIVTHPLMHQSLVAAFSIARSELSGGRIAINGLLTYRRKGRIREVLNDNLHGTSHAPLLCMVADEDLPGADRCSYGDIHVHSQFSQSHVEWGPPLSAIATMARAYGLSFAAITDHSYDLACSMQDYLKLDPTLPRWKAVHEGCSDENRKYSDFKLLQGEEITVRAADGKLVHLGAVGLCDYIEGSDDGARRARKPDSLSIPEACARIAAQGALAFAAHPGSQPGFLQQTFLERGRWNLNDISDHIIFQALNSGFSDMWQRGKLLWIEALLSGKHIALGGGNDAHGDFSRYRSVALPFFSIHELHERHLGYGRTGVYGPCEGVSGLMEGLAGGRTFVTTGPWLDLCGDDGSSLIGSDIPHAQKQISLWYATNKEFGSIVRIRLVQGCYASKKETLIADIAPPEEPWRGMISLDIDRAMGRGYLRAECLCEEVGDAQRCAAFTSPCYIAT